MHACSCSTFYRLCDVCARWSDERRRKFEMTTLPQVGSTSASGKARIFCFFLHSSLALCADLFFVKCAWTFCFHHKVRMFLGWLCAGLASSKAAEAVESREEENFFASEIKLSPCFSIFYPDFPDRALSTKTCCHHGNSLLTSGDSESAALLVFYWCKHWGSIAFART